MDKTENLGLKKPSQDDYYNVDDFNYNADVIDAKLEELETPEYTEVIELQELSSGETLGVLIGKLAKVVKDFISHIANTDNPHKVTKSQIGLGNVNNTSDVNKPISTATQKALDGIEDEIDAIPTECFTPQNMIPYPYYDIASGASVTKNGITITDNGDGTVTVGAGTATAQVDIKTAYISQTDDSGGICVEEGENYTLTGCPEGGSGSTYHLWTNYINDNNNWSNYGMDSGNGLAVVGNGKHMTVTIRIKAGAIISEPITFKPMLVKGPVAQPFTPHSLSSEALRDTKATSTVLGRVKLTDSSAVTDSTGLALPATEKNASIEGTLANQISEVTSSLTTIENSLAKTSGINNILFQFSAQANSVNNFYYTNSVYIPNNYELEVKTASFLGSVGDFASQITMHKSGNYICFYSANSAFAGLTLSVEAQMVESA